MKNEDAHANRTCRVVVLSILGMVVITFLLVAWLFHHPAVGKQRPFSTTTPAQRK